MKALEFIYQDTQIHSLLNPQDKDVMINATEMAKLFKRRTEDFLKTQSTKDFINSLENEIIHPLNRGRIIDNRGRNGIYFCEILALKFAAWLDPKFEIWVYQTIRDLLTKNTKKVTQTLIDKEAKILEINKLKQEAKSTKNQTALDLIKAQEELKAIENAVRKATTDFKKGQLSIIYDS